MAQNIYAWLDNGLPRLRVIDSETGRVNVAWDFRPPSAEAPGQRLEIQRLFRQLLLLTCKQGLENVRCYGLKPSDFSDVLNAQGGVAELAEIKKAG